MNIKQIENSFKETSDKKCSVSKKGMVSTAFPDATRAGIEILEAGGNAVDAACAAAFALSVCEPQSSGLGGQSMAILHIKGKSIAIDGSSRVPSLAHISRFKEKERFVGYRAATVPSTPAVLGYLNFFYGKLPWAKIIEPAIKIAKNGYVITELQQELQNRELIKFFEVQSCSGAKYFLKNSTEAYKKGDLFVQKDLASLLEYLAKYGPRAFYTGDIAQQIDKDMKANDGFLRTEDLALIPWPIERKPLKRRYRDINVVTVPPPAAGRTLLLVLMVLNNLSSRLISKGSPEIFHFIAETFRKTFLQRKQRPFDPNTYPQISDKKMISREFANILAKSIRETIDPGLPLIEPPIEEGETTHISVIDSESNVIGITQSIEKIYGSKAAAEGLGFLYNNYMCQLDIKSPQHPYYLRPNAIPWSTVAPAILFLRNRPWIIVGSPGSERIYSTITQFIINIIDRSLSMCEAIKSPRFHCSIGGKISIEAGGFSPEIINYLENIGYKLDKYETYSFYLGAIHAVMKCQTKDEFQGVAEVRRDGTAQGPF